MGTATPVDLHYYAPSGGSQAMAIQAAGANQAATPEFASVPPLDRAIVTLVSRASGMVVGRDEALSNAAALPTGALAAGGRIGGDQILTTTGLIVDALVVYPTAPTEPEMAAVRAALRALYATRAAPLAILQYRGDSITNGVGAIKGYSLPRLVADLIADRGVLSYKSGVNGATVSATLSPVWAVPGVARRMLHLWYGTNNIAANSDPAASVLAWLEAAADRARTNGFDKVVAGTMLPRAGLTAAQRDERIALNAGIRASAKFDAVADYAANATMGAAGAEANTALYPDGIHPSHAGYEALKTDTKRAIETVLAQPATLAIAGVAASATQGTAYPGFAPTVSGGTLPYRFTLASGALPTGLTLDAATGAIAGTPSASSSVSATIRVTDSQSPPRSADLAVTITVNAAVAFVLDQMTAVATRAFSTRRLRGGYAGAALRVRRDSDSAEADIGFAASGDLDTAALATFVGTAKGVVVAWYDQSMNAQPFTQATTASAPIIHQSGATKTVNGRAAMTFGSGLQLGGTLSGAPGQRTVVGVFLHSNVQSGSILGTPTSNGYVLDVTGSHQLALRKYPGSTTIATSTGTGALNTPSTFRAVHDGAALTYAFAIDGVDAGSGTLASAAGGTGTTARIGSVVGNYSGFIPELLVFDGALLSTADQAAARANLKAYWGTA